MNKGTALGERMLFYRRLSLVCAIVSLACVAAMYLVLFLSTFGTAAALFLLMLAGFGGSWYCRGQIRKASLEMNALMTEQCDPEALALGMEVLERHTKPGPKQAALLINSVQARQMAGDFEGSRTRLQSADPAWFMGLSKVVYYSLAGRDKLQAGDIDGAVKCRQAILETALRSPQEQQAADDWQLVLQLQILLAQERFAEARSLVSILQPKMRVKMQRVTFSFSLAQLYLGESNPRSARDELDFVIANGNTMDCVRKAKELLLTPQLR